MAADIDNSIRKADDLVDRTEADSISGERSARMDRRAILFLSISAAGAISEER